MSRELNPQELYWAQEDIGNRYIHDNLNFDLQGGIKAWNIMLRSTKLITGSFSFLECGSNVGRNIKFLKEMSPSSSANVIEINKQALKICVSNNQIETSFLGSLLEVQVAERFDLVYSIAVLIHVNPQDLLSVMQRMFDWSKKYILIGEYFNRTEVTIPYRGSNDQLFKRDFGKLFIENFNAKCIDYGFLWGQEYDDAGFDDITWWLFEKNVN